MNLALRQRLKDNFRGDSGGSALANLNSAIDQKFTLAAREGRDTQADIDGLLEDLVELGVIDGEGNIK